MADLLPARTTSSPKPNGTALVNYQTACAASSEVAVAGLPERVCGPRPPENQRLGPAFLKETLTAKIMLVEDQMDLQRALRLNLRARLYDVTVARTGCEALAMAVSHPPDAIILDLGLPDIDGTEVIVELRRWYRAPIMVLSGLTSQGAKISALDAGADDYVIKPFVMAELLARLRAVLRRAEGRVVHDQPSQVVIGNWQIDLSSHRVTRADAPAAPSESFETLRLTPTEWAILELLLRRPGQLIGSAQLLTTVWGPGFRQRTNYLRFHMARLRGKLEDTPTHPRHLLTEHGMGYRYQP